jgi:hypothetical protein
LGLARSALDQPVKDHMNPRSSNPIDPGDGRRFAAPAPRVDWLDVREVLVVSEGTEVR